MISDALQIRRTSDSEAPAFNEHVVEGYAIVWDTVNDYGETCVRGCCADSLKRKGLNGKEGNQIRFLLQHDSRKILGRLEELKEDEKGLFFRASIYPNLSYSQDAIELIKAGELRQLSYGFQYGMGDGDYEFREDGVVVLRKIDLYEISLVTFSSDPEAQLRAARDGVRSMWDGIRAERERARFGFDTLAKTLYTDKQ